MSVKKTASCQIALLILLSLLMVLVLSACVNTPGAEDAQAQISIRFAAEITDCDVPVSRPWAYHSYYANPMGGHT